jgi:hypothetical protein
MTKRINLPTVLMLIAVFISCSKGNMSKPDKPIDPDLAFIFKGNSALINQFSKQITHYYGENLPLISRNSGFISSVAKFPNELIGETTNESINLFYLEINSNTNSNEKTYYTTFVNANNILSDSAFLMRTLQINQNTWHVIYQNFNGSVIAAYKVVNGQITQVSQSANNSGENTIFTELEELEELPPADAGGSPYGRCVAAHLNAMTSGSLAGALLGLTCLIASPECAAVIASKCAIEVLFTNRWN